MNIFPPNKNSIEVAIELDDACSYILDEHPEAAVCEAAGTAAAAPARGLVVAAASGDAGAEQQQQPRHVPHAARGEHFVLGRVARPARHHQRLELRVVKSDVVHVAAPLRRRHRRRHHRLRHPRSLTRGHAHAINKPHSGQRATA